MTVTWMCSSSTPSHFLPSATPPASPGSVSYGPAGAPPVMSAPASRARPAGNHTWAFTARMGGLKAGVRFAYVLPGDASGRPREFSAPPASASPFTVAVIGDMGISGSKDTTSGLAARAGEYDWILHAGDYACADDRGVLEYEATWDAFFRQVEPLAEGKAYATLMGNHGVVCHSYGDYGCPAMYSNASVFRARFSPPHAESGSPTPAWYSFDYGNAHFVFVDTETSYPHSPEGAGSQRPYGAGPFGDQLAWLKADLTRANLPASRAARPWLIVAGHRPLYSSERVDSPANVLETVRSTFEPLFLEARVDLYLCGHVHAFEANYQARDGVVTQRNFKKPGAPVSVVNGAAGNTEGHNTGNWLAKTPGWLAYRNTPDYGYGMMTVHNGSALTYSFYAAARNEKAYEFTIAK